MLRPRAPSGASVGAPLTRPNLYAMAKGQATVYETRYKEHVIRFTPGSGEKPYETDGQAFATEDEAKKHIRATFFDDGEPAVKWPRTECFEEPSIYGHGVGHEPTALVITGPRTDFGRYDSRGSNTEVRTKEKDAPSYKRNEWRYRHVDRLVLDNAHNRELVKQVNALEKERKTLQEKQSKLLDRLTKVDRKLYGIKGRDES